MTTRRLYRAVIDAPWACVLVTGDAPPVVVQEHGCVACCVTVGVDAAGRKTS